MHSRGKLKLRESISMPLRFLRSRLGKAPIVLSEAFANHSNRLFQAIQYEAFCIEHGHRFCNISFLDMANYYKGCKVGPWSALLSRVPKCLFNNNTLVHLGIRQDSLSLSHLHWACELFPVVFVGGFSFWVGDLTLKYRNYFIEKYAIKDEFLNNVALVHEIQEWRSCGFTVIGLHIRRGDYRQYLNGRYCYDDYTYARYAKELSILLASKGKRVKTVAFSNDHTGIEQLIECRLSLNEWYIDHHLMSICDMLIGPPSTFTMWASYMGKVPCFHIETPSSPIGVESFRCF